MAKNTVDFTIPTDGYVAFDAVGLRDLIIARLNQQQVFTDQNYTGSNISTIIEIVAYSYHVLMFYLNQAGSESQFTQASLYENINKIVKALNYNPIGYQTATLAFNCTGQASLPTGSHTIPRYSYFQLNGVAYSFNKDVTFVKLVENTDETLTDVSSNNLLYQGAFKEYPKYTATGEPFEIVTVAVNNTTTTGSRILVDHFNVHVYVRDNSQTVPTYTQYTPVESLFLETGDAKVYEIRLNEGGVYEVKFGDDIHGRQLNTNDEVLIYYLQSSGPDGVVGTNALNSNSLLFYNSPQYADITPAGLNIISAEHAAMLVFTNDDNGSTAFQDIESVSSIRTNALNTFKTQYRLITTTDFETYILKNFGNIISSVKCISNSDFVNGHLKYFFDLGVEQPSIESRILLNQVKFSSSSNFNNVYAYCVPELANTTSLNTRLNYLSTAQKQLLSTRLQPYKLITSEVVFVDPIYTIIDFGINNIGESPTPDISTDTYLQIVASKQQQQNFSHIQQSAATILQSYFDTSKNNLGKLIDLTDLSTQLLEIPGVSNVQTVRVTGNVTVSLPGLSFIAYNPVYPDNDITVSQQNLQLPYYKFPILNDSANIVNKIKVITATS